MRRCLHLLLIALSSLCFAQDTVGIIPCPTQTAISNNMAWFLFTGNVDIQAGEDLKNEQGNLEAFISSLPFQKNNTKPWKPAGNNTVEVVLSTDSSLKKEEYRLKIGGGAIEIRGGSPAGVFYGIQSFKQLVLMAFNEKEGRCFLPLMTISDSPVCEWRGVLLDSARHNQGKDYIKKFIDIIAFYKFNRLHWHLVDSDAWRLEIKKYPKLVEVGKDMPSHYSTEDPANLSFKPSRNTGNLRSGGYYTHEDVREIVAYAKTRHVEIMPEIEFPAHSAAALTAYPEFSATGRVPDYKRNMWSDLFGVDDRSMQFLKDVLDETMDLFPFDVIHLGGDEAPMDDWKESPSAQKRMKELGFTKEIQLQAWMFNEIAKHIAKRGKRAAGWEEIMHGDNLDTLTKGSIVMPWLSMQSAVTAANAGYGVIHCRGNIFYLDHKQTKSRDDHWAQHDEPITLEQIYAFNLFPEGLTEEGRKNIYGAEGLLWAELMPTPKDVEYQAFPRLTAIAELLWSQEENKNYQKFYSRLQAHRKILDFYEINYRPIDPLPSETGEGTENEKGR